MTSSQHSMTGLLAFRATRDLRRRIEKYAAAAGMTVSEYIRVKAQEGPTPSLVDREVAQELRTIVIEVRRHIPGSPPPRLTAALDRLEAICLDVMTCSSN